MSAIFLAPNQAAAQDAVAHQEEVFGSPSPGTVVSEIPGHPLHVLYLGEVIHLTGAHTSLGWRHVMSGPDVDATSMEDA